MKLEIITGTRLNFMKIVPIIEALEKVPDKKLNYTPSLDNYFTKIS